MPQELTPELAKKLPWNARAAYDVSILICDYLKRAGRLQDEWSDAPLDGIKFPVLAEAVRLHDPRGVTEKRPAKPHLGLDLTGNGADDKTPENPLSDPLAGPGPGVEAVLAAVAEKGKKPADLAAELLCSEDRIRALVAMEGSGLKIGAGGRVMVISG